MNKFKLLLIGTFIAITGCTNIEREVIETKTVNVKVVSKKPPKRFSVTFQLEDGTELKHSQKRCSKHTKYVVGNQVDIKVEVVKITNTKENTTQTNLFPVGVCT